MRKIFSLLGILTFLLVPSLASAAQTCRTNLENVPANINLEKVRETWLTWHNDARKAKGLRNLSSNDQLNYTATLWSEQAKKKGTITHKRAGQTLFFDYQRLKQWFISQGVRFRNIGGFTMTESIAWNSYKCSESDSDCTDAFLKAARRVFDSYMGEKNLKNRPHYLSIMNPKFRIIGLGVSINPTSKKFFLTVHYGTEVTSKSLPICEKSTLT